MADFPSMSLKTAPFQFAEFKPVTYTPQEIDLGILNRSMDKIEARTMQSRASADAFVSAANEMRKQLNPLEYKAFDERVANIRQQIDDRIQLGDSASAVLLASDLGRELAADPTMHNKINIQEDWEKQRSAIQNGNYTNYTKRRWDDVNRYIDDGTGTFTPSFTPVPDMSLDDVLQRAVNQTPTRSTSSQSSRTSNSHTFVDSSGNVTNRPTTVNTETAPGPYKPGMAPTVNNTNVAGTVIGSFATNTVSRGSGSSVQEKRAEDIENMFYSMLNDSNIRASLKQNFDNMLWLKDNANKILNDPTATDAQKAQARTDLDTATSILTNKDGFEYKSDNDYDEWINNKAREHFRNSAYRHTQTSSTVSNTTSYNDGAFGAVYGLRQQEVANSLSPQGTATVQSGNITFTSTPAAGNYNAAGMGSLFQ